jgi:hypothetical protein
MLKAQEKRMQELFSLVIYFAAKEENSWKDKRLTYRDKKNPNIFLYWDF